jgi:hypothetical protein
MNNLNKYLHNSYKRQQLLFSYEPLLRKIFRYFKSSFSVTENSIMSVCFSKFPSDKKYASQTRGSVFINLRISVSSLELSCGTRGASYANTKVLRNH